MSAGLKTVEIVVLDVFYNILCRTDKPKRAPFITGPIEEGETSLAAAKRIVAEWTGHEDLDHLGDLGEVESEEALVVGILLRASQSTDARHEELSRYCWKTKEEVEHHLVEGSRQALWWEEIKRYKFFPF